jgi:hypothetical protein
VPLEWIQTFNSANLDFDLFYRVRTISELWWEVFPSGRPEQCFEFVDRTRVLRRSGRNRQAVQNPAGIAIDRKRNKTTTSWRTEVSNNSRGGRWNALHHWLWSARISIRASSSPTETSWFSTAVLDRPSFRFSVSCRASSHTYKIHAWFRQCWFGS